MRKLSVSGTLTLSSNKVVAFTEYVDDFDNGGQVEIAHSNTDLAFSPNVVAGLGILYDPIRNLEVSWTAKYVGRQYLDNTSNRARSIDAYLVNNLGVNYTLESASDKRIKYVKLGVQVNNILNEVYENNGYTYSYVYGGTTTTENFYYPQAGIHLMTRLVLGF